MKEKRLLTITQVAGQLGVTNETVKNWIRKGCLRSRTVGGWKMIDGNSLKSLFDDLSDIAQMEDGIRQLKRELINEKKAISKILFFAKENHSLLDYIHISPINRDILSRIIRSLGSQILTSRETEIVCMYIENGNLLTVGEAYDLTAERIRTIVTKAISKLGCVKSYSDIANENNTLKEDKRLLSSALEDMTDKNKKLIAERSMMEKNLDCILPENAITEEEIKVCELAYRNITEFCFSARLRNILRAADIETVGDMIQLNEKELMKLRNFGRKCLWEVLDFAEDNGITLGKDLTDLKRRHALHLARMKAEEEAIAV